MLLPSIRRLALADVEGDALKELIRHGEDLLVERKRQPPEPPRFGASASAFANMLGGFILLGVDDDGTVVGYETPKRVDLQSHLAALLRQQVDPLPPFVAGMRMVDGKSVAVVRVFESADSPHIVRGTGAIYVRSSKGKDPVPVDDHRTLLALARRGEEAESKAKRRLADLPLIERAMQPPGRPGRPRDPQHARVTVRAAPMTVTPQFADWPISGVGARWCLEAVTRLCPAGGHLLIPQARGAIARKKALQPSPGDDMWAAIVAADSGGVVSARLALPLPDLIALHQLRREMIVPPLNVVAEALKICEAYGRAALDAWLSLPGNVTVDGSEAAPRRPEDVKERHVNGELTIPADEEEIAALGRQWERELARGFGIARWEGAESGD